MLRTSLPFTRLPWLVTRACFKFKNAAATQRSIVNATLTGPSSATARLTRAGVAVGGSSVARSSTAFFQTRHISSSVVSCPRSFASLALAPKEAEENIIVNVSTNMSAKNLVLNKMWQHIETGEENAFYVVDIAAVEERYNLWMKHLPFVKPYYAVKCNPDPSILKTLARLGTGFDCASQAEIQDVMNCGVDPSKIIYANPCKQPSHIGFAANHGVDFMTFDGCDELNKMKKINPHARVVLRIFVDDTHSQCPLGTKFGASMDDVPVILRHAKTIGSHVVGVSFHVGSGCSDASAYADAVLRARHAFDIGHSLGFDFDVLDIGGGFPGDENAPVSFEEIANALHSSLQHHFPPSSGVRIISEPGRFFAAASHTLAVNVIGRKLAPNSLSSQASFSPLLSPSFVCPSSSSSSSSISAIAAQKAFQGKRQLHGGSHTEPHYMYFVNDGLYGSFNCLLYDHAVVHPIALSPEDGRYVTTTTTAAANRNDSTIMTMTTFDEQPQEPPERPRQPPTYTASIWGPTCDGLDCIAKDIQMPVLDIGQWIYFPNMGAYTSAAGSHFNGFAPPEKIYFDSKEEVASMES